MAPRRNLKQLEPAETAAEAGYVSPPKKRKAQQDIASNKSDPLKETNVKAPRLPRAAKSSKIEQAVVIESEPVKKLKTTGKPAQAKKPSVSVNPDTKANVKAKKGKTAKKEAITENTHINCAEDVKKPFTKKTRSKIVKKAGREGPKRSKEELMKEFEKDNVTDNAEEAEGPQIEEGESKNERIGDSNAEGISRSKEKVNEKKKVGKQTNVTTKITTKIRGKGVANVVPVDDKNVVEAVPKETGNTARRKKAASKMQARKKKDTSTDNVKNEKKAAKPIKSLQKNITKLLVNEKSLSKKGRAKKQSDLHDQKEPDAELSTDEIAVDPKALLHSTVITENDKHGNTTPASENVATSKDLTSPNTKEEEKPSSEGHNDDNLKDNPEDIDEPPRKRRRNKKQDTHDSNVQRSDKIKGSAKISSKAGRDTGSPRKVQGIKKKDISTDIVNNEKKTTKESKGQQGKATKSVMNDNLPSKKMRGKRPAAVVEKEEFEVGLNAEEKALEQGGLNHSIIITENNEEGAV